MADKIVGSVRHKGVTYKAGDEAKFAAAIKAKESKLDGEELQRLADRGTITGFGTKAAADDDAETPKSKKGGKGKKGDE